MPLFAVESELSTDFLRPLKHADDAKVTKALALGIEAGAIVFDHHSDLFRRLFQMHFQAPCARVVHHIIDCFLSDAQHLIFDFR